jgi:hypothetical protein
VTRPLTEPDGQQLSRRRTRSREISRHGHSVRGHDPVLLRAGERTHLASRHTTRRIPNPGFESKGCHPRPERPFRRPSAPSTSCRGRT